MVFVVQFAAVVVIISEVVVVLRSLSEELSEFISYTTYL